MQNSLTKRKRRGRRNIKERRSEDPVSEKDEVRNQQERSANSAYHFSDLSICPDWPVQRMKRISSIELRTVSVLSN